MNIVQIDDSLMIPQAKSRHHEKLVLKRTADGSETVIATEPLHTLLEKVTGKPKNAVDFWSLDYIEGSETDVLKNTDFAKVEVGVLLIEMNKSAENNAGITAVMKQNGFRDIGTSKYTNPGHIDDLDHVFVNDNYFKSRGITLPGTLGGPQLAKLWGAPQAGNPDNCEKQV